MKRHQKEDQTGYIHIMIKRERIVDKRRPEGTAVNACPANRRDRRSPHTNWALTSLSLLERISRCASSSTRPQEDPSTTPTQNGQTLPRETGRERGGCVGMGGYTCTYVSSHSVVKTGGGGRGTFIMAALQHPLRAVLSTELLRCGLQYGIVRASLGTLQRRWGCNLQCSAV